ncbi:uncharacterized protein LOC143920482 [Arctopsyche grandis]|uniref:uncharacterized protein LOC143920482 n=1 Tax=Arctopsyche grandis TaxID=121162 RepID=UPI00406D9804
MHLTILLAAELLGAAYQVAAVLDDILYNFASSVQSCIQSRDSNGYKLVRGDLGVKIIFNVCSKSVRAKIMKRGSAKDMRSRASLRWGANTTPPAFEYSSCRASTHGRTLSYYSVLLRDSHGRQESNSRCVLVERGPDCGRHATRIYRLSPPLGAFPGAPPQPQGPFLPAPPHQAAPQYGVPGGAPYGVFPASAAGQLYAPPPSYDQALAAHHPPINIGQQVMQQMYSPAAMYAAAGYPGYIGYPVQYYPYYPASAAAAAMQPSIQPLRPTIMIPNGFEAGARFDGVGQPLLPPAPPGVPPSPAQLAAMAGHQVALSQKKGSFLTGSAEGGYTFW